MKKLLVIREKDKRNFFSKLAEKLFFARILDCYSGIDAEIVIDVEKPDYIMIDIIKPVNGDDLVSMLRLIDGNVRLRVAIFNIGIPKMKFLRLKYLLLHTEKSR